MLTRSDYGSWADEMEDMPLPSSWYNLHHTARLANSRIATDSRPGYGSERRGWGTSSAGFGGERSFGGGFSG